MSKLQAYPNQAGEIAVYSFYCPACGCEHPYDVINEDPSHRWEFNGDLDKPTFTPSLRVMHRGPDSGTACHCYVTDGRIRYCDDCPHKLAGQTIDMVDVEE